MKIFNTTKNETRLQVKEKVGSIEDIMEKSNISLGEMSSSEKAIHKETTSDVLQTHSSDRKEIWESSQIQPHSLQG